MGTIFTFSRRACGYGSLFFCDMLCLPFITREWLREHPKMSCVKFGTLRITYTFDQVCSDSMQNNKSSTHMPLWQCRSALSGDCVFWWLVKSVCGRVQTERSCPRPGTGSFAFCRTQGSSSPGPVEQNDFANRSFAVLFVGTRSHSVSPDPSCLHSCGEGQQGFKEPHRQTHFLKLKL